ncbi:ATP-binding protein [Peribacillus loiseleuriae]|uniref:histidine kinase n=1 Tax=Peribacillus loiseleuriae TaxID=1679170 RepID=A0A0K9GPQ7_9BACI|nr:ATP-binding protein [Peribacillus loiseleuriae]KMY48566.1 hypothetical protein AC625_02755 [Peribacillus loiseleuriae]
MNQVQKFALMISLIYVLIGVVWITGTDSISMLLAKDNFHSYAIFQRVTGWVYIFLTGSVLYVTLNYWGKKLLHSENKLKRKDVQYRSLFKHNPDAVIELDLEGNINSINPEGETILGVTEEEVRGKCPTSAISIENVEKVREYYWLTLEGVKSYFEAIIHLGGHKKILRCSFFPIIVNEEIVGVYALARDITSQRNDEEMLIASEKMTVIGHLAAAVAHEIRNPLTSLKGFVQLMRTEKQVDPHYLKIMEEEIEHINIISSELLILGKKQAISLRLHDVRECVTKVVWLMKAQANLDNLELEMIEPTDQPILVIADDVQLKQVFINLIKNSIEAVGKDGKIKVEVRETETDAIIIVSDNGKGIDEERLKYIAQPFYSTKEKGTGLGLSISYKIIHRHNGEMSFESKKGEGTVVTVRIPLANDEEQMIL